MMDLDKVYEILSEVKFEDWSFEAAQSGNVMWLRARFIATDLASGHDVVVASRKWILSKYMTGSEVVLTAFKAVLTALEHEAREMFTYRGRAILGPHISIEALVQAVDAKLFDARPEAPR